jgi:small conductance mechanosensitive channel
MGTDTSGGGLIGLLQRLDELNISNLLAALLILAAGYVIIRLLTGGLARVLNRSGRLDVSLRKYLVLIVKILLLFALFIIVASRLGIPIDSLVTILATLGLAVSLAMQDSLKNVAGGIVLLSSKPFVTGDFVEIGGVTGQVAQVGMIHTQLITGDNRKVYVPNSKVAGDTVVNYSALDKRRVELSLRVPYDCDLALARRVISETLTADERVLDEPEAPFVRVWELSPSSVVILARAWCRTEDYWELRSALIEAVKLSLDEAGISIPHGWTAAE